jgi:hypothetical protein
VTASGDRDQGLIDLDAVRPSPSQPPSWTWPPWGRSHTRAAAAIALLLTALVAAADTAAGVGRSTSAPPVVSAPVTVPISGAPQEVIGDTLYTRADSGARINAYSLRTGRRRWSTAVPRTTNPMLVDAGDYLLVASYNENLTVAIDTRTGVVRWQRPGYLLWPGPSTDRAVLETQQPPDDGAGVGRTVFRIVSVASGQERAVFTPIGNRPVSVVLSVDTPGFQASGVFVREDENGGELFDFATGRVRPLALPGSPPPPYDSGARYETLFTVGDLVLVASGSASSGSDRDRKLTGYGGQPLSPRWLVSGLGFASAWRCADALCVSDYTRAAAVDLATGRTRWDSRWGIIWPASGHRMLASNQAGDADSRGIGVLDADSGRELLRQDLWRPVARVTGARVPILAYSEAGQTLGILDVDRLVTYRVGLVDRALADCWADNTHVVCRDGPDSVLAWRYAA